ncbi:hypothetical protein [Streptomyces yunnanensis]|uniref:hypothetical protein n=1 Tax=Streptomyces yunnanensis TaxID=156453 RepID=UPI003B833090
MYISIVLWNLKNSKATVEDLREYLRDYAVDAFSTLKGMRMKTWFADAEKGYWGGGVPLGRRQHAEPAVGQPGDRHHRLPAERPSTSTRR